MGVVSANSLITSSVTPASSGVDGPGDRMIFSGFNALILHFYFDRSNITIVNRLWIKEKKKERNGSCLE